MDLTLVRRCRGSRRVRPYRYRFCTTTGDHSAVGTFKTPPSSGANANINFAYGRLHSRDSPRGSNSTTPFYNSFDVFQFNGEEVAGLRCARGDVIYSDSVAGDRKNPTAVTREEKTKYRENLGNNNFSSYERQPVSTRIGMTTRGQRFLSDSEQPGVVRGRVQSIH